MAMLINLLVVMILFSGTANADSIRDDEIRLSKLSNFADAIANKANKVIVIHGVRPSIVAGKLKISDGIYQFTIPSSLTLSGKRKSALDTCAAQQWCKIDAVLMMGTSAAKPFEWVDILPSHYNDADAYAGDLHSVLESHGLTHVVKKQ